MSVNRFKEAQSSVQTKNTDLKEHGNFKLVQAGKPDCVHDSGTTLMVFLEAFAGKKRQTSCSFFFFNVYYLFITITKTETLIYAH